MSAMVDRRDFLSLMLAGTTAFAMVRSARADTTDFKFIMPFTLTLSFGAVLYADAARYYADEGLKMDVESGKGAALAEQMVIARQMDAGRTGGTNYIISRVNHGAPAVSIATIAQMSPFYIISSKSKPVNSVADLKGLTVGMASLGGSMEGALDLMMLSHHVSPKSVNKVKIPDNAASYALVQAGRAGALIGSAPTMLHAEAVHPDIMAIPLDDHMPGQVYVAHPDEVKASPDKFVKFLRATHKSALEIVKADKFDPILDKIGSKFDVAGLSNRRIAAKILADSAMNWAAKGQKNLLRNVPEVWANAVTLLAENHMIDKTVDPAILYDNSLLDKALAS